MRAILHRGWWLVTSLYLVVEAGLSPLELVLLGTAQGLTVIVCEVPAGLIADNYSRKWSIVVSQVIMGLGMLATGLVMTFPALVVTQMIWGLSWTFASGADVAWINDELDEPEQIGPILAKAASWNQWGSAIGISGIGFLAWQTSLSVAIITSGTLMLFLGVYVASSFTEQRFKPSQSTGFAGLKSTLKTGTQLVASDRSIAIVLVVTFLINGADEVFSRLLPKGLIDLGLPVELDPILWLVSLGLVTLCVGGMVLHIAQNRMTGEPTLRCLYVIACFVGASGMLLFSVAPNHWIAMCGVILVHGIAWNIARVVSVIWINGRSRNRERATVLSFLAQAENFGEVVLGASLALVAQCFGLPASFVSAAIVVLVAIGFLSRMQAKR